MKMMLFQKAIFIIKFPEIVKNSIFLLNFYQKLKDFLRKRFPKNLCFSPKRKKLTDGLLNFRKIY